MTNTFGKSNLLVIAGFAAALGSAGPVLAQSSDTSQHGNTAAPSGSLTMSHGDWRSSQLVGATVYNSTGDSIGKVDDILVGPTGKFSNAVISVGGFLGIGDKLVEVPFNKLKLTASKSNPESGSKKTAGETTATDSNRDYGLVLPNATKDSLTTMTAFKYDAS